MLDLKKWAKGVHWSLFLDAILTMGVVVPAGLLVLLLI
jgi:hypothetical protein